MIYTWFDNIRGSRVKADKALEMTELVGNELDRREIDFSSSIIDYEEKVEILPRYVTATYLLIGFNPEIAPELNEKFSDYLQKNNSLTVGSMILPFLASMKQSPSQSETFYVEQDAHLFDGYGVGRMPQKHPNSYNERGKISLRQSVRAEYKKSKEGLAKLIADVAVPLFKVPKEVQIGYLQGINLCVKLDRPDIFQIAEAAKKFSNKP